MIALHDYLETSAKMHPDRPAVWEDTGPAMTYRELDVLSNRLRDRLAANGISRGDRVGICVRKSIDSVAAIFGILKSGAAYVPVDVSAPAARNGFIFANCAVKAVIIEGRLESGVREAMADAAGRAAWVVLPDVGHGQGLDACLEKLETHSPALRGASASPQPNDLAYVLYTSGSTGRPKGVMLSQLNATAFVDWCCDLLHPAADDRFSSHAPFHFDLSILDLYTPIRNGASIVLVPDDLTREPQGLALFIERMNITIWYSAPSILSLLAQFGKLPERNYSMLRAILFAGEVFPIVHLRSLTRQVPHPRYLNLYGPTETNVCNAYELEGPVPDDRLDPYPIGPVCPHLRGIVIDGGARKLPAGEEGELCITGDNVMQGYWDLPEQTAKSFITDDAGIRWYKTGDIVVEDAGGIYRYVGRRDRMVKKRGYRIELGEIESALYRNPDVCEAAVIALRDDIEGVKIKAHLTLKESGRPSIIQFKRYCSENLPIYMVPDSFHFHQRLPKTSTDKIDYQALHVVG